MNPYERQPSRHPEVTALLADSASAGQELARVYAALVHRVGGPTNAPAETLRMLRDCYVDQIHGIGPSMMRARRHLLPQSEAWAPLIEAAAQEVCEVAELLTRRMVLGDAEPIAPVTWWPSGPPLYWLDPHRLARSRAEVLEREVRAQDSAELAEYADTPAGGVR
jgi:hypothetical protein